MKLLIISALYLCVACSLTFAQSYKIIESSSDNIKIEFNFENKYRIRDTLIEGNKFQYIEGDEYFFGNPGDPYIPGVLLNIGIPFNSNPQVKVLSIDQEKIQQVLSRYGIKPPYIFYVGRLEKKKNIARLIYALAIMREKYGKINHKLVLVGNAGLGFDEVKYMIEEFDLNNDVIITGWVPERDMPYIYNGASLFVFPSLYEGFGIPLVQAMAVGVPIAASDIASIREIAGRASWLFDPKEASDMAEKMAEVLLDKELADDLIDRGKARVKDFSLAKCAKETLAVIERM